ncbi:MAG: hypothetical protein A2430_00330 [Candidatus Liptonbacteria bacterium RIFOXYC1_FULL_36_8]|uniref:Uncharacterized protein n=3 Tax=Candidatus Liptoniibacteriota TaxID=1817909 RepID=A0A1G2CPM4_9BACT|nr:MAG: hypothetical protein A2604_01095 [Candidatus Liptonbacteria bacterium RIFOXYD1_FULL_36_11]OGZ03076.1 MAG: hypothetical protein A2430_00330 [Candidatus Liptonbacteria bacterium RIFOXYC1_FULL_36_8]OGZ03197.1 MAG: hypothetical protein A2390_00590 [Candidatus Liptonbacteria bacterium RIFOXYB1_FULL_36_10]
MFFDYLFLFSFLGLVFFLVKAAVKYSKTLSDEKIENLISGKVDAHSGNDGEKVLSEGQRVEFKTRRTDRWHDSAEVVYWCRRLRSYCLRPVGQKRASFFFRSEAEVRRAV